MGSDARHAPACHEPLGLRVREAHSRETAVRRLRFEFTSRGDRVPGRLLLPAQGSGPAPLVLLEHGAGGHKDSPYVDAAALPWVRRGAAVVTIDLPLHGERASPKLTGWLLESAALGRSPGPFDAILWREFARQAVADLSRALDALEGIAGLDSTRVAYAGFSLGALVGACFCALDARPRAVALALAGAGLGPDDLDAARHVAALAPRPLLLVNARHDARIPPEAAERLFAAAREPKRQLWFDATHTELPGRALKAMWTFLAPQLGLAGG